MVNEANARRKSGRWPFIKESKTEGERKDLGRQDGLWRNKNGKVE